MDITTKIQLTFAVILFIIFAAGIIWIIARIIYIIFKHILKGEEWPDLKRFNQEKIK